MTYDAPVRGCAIRQETSWNKFSSCWVMSQSRRQSDTSGASSGFAMRSTITSGWSRMRPRVGVAGESYSLADFSGVISDKLVSGQRDSECCSQRKVRFKIGY